VYTAQGTIEKSHLLAQHQPMVRRIALQMIAKLPASVELDDLIQAGMIGLLDASNRYEDNRGAQFETFVSQRIRGAMLDELRASDWGSRGLRASARKVEQAIQALEHRLGRAPNEGEIAKELKMTLEAYQGLLQEVQGCQLLYVEDFSQGESESSFLDANAQEARSGRGSDDPLQQLLESGFRHQLIDAIGSLPERDQLLLNLYYEEELNLREIGAVLEVSQSRVCQLHSQAISRLRVKLKDLL
jgi:RNA polymerase sigma factor for flagellar operon FliA